MDLVFLFYGLAFLALGLVLVIWPKQDSHYEFSVISTWLAAFAFVHGMLEWMDLWRVVRGDTPALAVLRPCTLLVSYLLLYEFGRRLVVASRRSDRAAMRFVLSARTHGFLLAGVVAGVLLGQNAPRDLTIWSRYLYGFPASMLAGIGFIAYYTHRIRPTLGPVESRMVRIACLFAGGAFFAYAVFGGLVVPRADWAPAAWLNQEAFQAATGVPVQVFRAVCAVALAFSVALTLRVFHLERGQRWQRALARTQAALEQADRLGRHNRLLLESVAEGVFGIDREGHTTFINPAALAMLGYAAEELIGQPMHDLTHHHHVDGTSFPVEACPTHQTLRDGQVRYVDNDCFWRKDGTRFAVEYHSAQISEGGEVIGAVVVFQDCSERLRIEAELAAYRHRLEDLVAQRTSELREQEERGRLILEASSNGLYGMDAEGRLIFINPAGSQLLGYAREDLIGVPVHDTLHHSHADGRPFPAETCPMLKALQTGEAERNDDDLFWRADGTPLQVATATQPMLKAGRIVGAVVSFVDISERKALDAARDRALSEAERLARVKSEFLANMSHEIRTPLNGVLGLAHVGMRESAGRGRASENYAKIIQSGKLLLGIINDILDYSKLEAGKLSIERVPMQPLQVIRDVATVIHERAQSKGLVLRIRKAPDLPECCLGDPLRLGQILMNLLSNAVKFTETGSVTLEVSRQGDALVFSVSDSGIGMTPAQIDLLFRPFEQADGSITRRFGGTGLGLAISHRLLGLMAGDITVESAPGKGSRFTVRLPCEAVASVVPLPEVPTAPASAAPLAGMRILVAEDNLVNQEVIRTLLEGDGAQVTLADNGVEAVEQVTTAGGEAFTAVLMDVQMPAMGGHEATRRIHEVAPDLPVIGQTAHAFADEIAACLEAGMVAHIAKPLDPDELVRLILRHARK